MTQRERSRKARRKWQKLISEQARSGKSVAAFCRERGLARSHFWWWKKRLRTPLTEIRGSETDRGRAGARGDGGGVEGGSPDATCGRPAASRRGAGGSRAPQWAGPLGGAGFDAAHVQALAAVLEREA